MDINVGILEDIEEHEKICDVGSDLNIVMKVAAQSRRQTSQMRRIVTVKAIVIKDKIIISRSFFTEWVARLYYTRFAWAGGTFSPVVLLCQFSVLAGNRFWFYILLMYLGYCTIQLRCCVSFFGSGGK